jgi:hypothetical protein
MILLIGIAVYVHDPGRGSQEGYGLGESGYAMVGGYETGRGMMNDYGSSDKHQYGLDAWGRSRHSPQEYNQNFSYHK